MFVFYSTFLNTTHPQVAGLFLLVGSVVATLFPDGSVDARPVPEPHSVATAPAALGPLLP